jgi:hypothetical protein
MSGEEDNFGCRREPPYLRRGLNSVHFGHRQVKDDDVRRKF